MALAISKRVVYGAAGMDPRAVLPVCVDFGCDSATVRDDPLYLGTRRGLLEQPLSCKQCLC
jgi:hypothetical protein